MDIIKLQIDEINLVKNLKNAFSTRTTFLAELMQNARRSCSPYVRFEIAEDTITVTDTGAGILDMQNLFSIAQSGWDGKTIDHEKPFGMGFLSALFAAKSVTVESYGKRVEFATEDALGFKAVQVHDCAYEERTTITLKGLAVTVDQINAALVKYSKGFSIPVTVVENGKTTEMKREHALDKSFIELETCWIRSDFSYLSMLIYYQDIAVADKWYDSGGRSVVHLKPEAYEAKMPDRDKLIDHEDAMKKIEAEVTAYVRQTLIRRKESMQPVEFIDSCYELLRIWKCKDLLNDIDIVPRQWIEKVCDYPVADRGEYDTSNDYITSFGSHITRKEIENSTQLLIHCDDLAGDGHNGSSCEDGFKLLMFLYRLQIPFIKDKPWDNGHWLEGFTLQLLNESDILVSYEEPANTYTYYSGGFYLLNQETSFCTAYNLSADINGEKLSVRIDNEGLNTGGDCIVIPEKEHSADVISQCSTFRGELDEYESSEADLEIEKFSNFVRLHQSNDSSEFLHKCITQGIGYNAVHLEGKRFIVEFPIGQDGIADNKNFIVTEALS